VNRSNF